METNKRKKDYRDSIEDVEVIENDLVGFSYDYESAWQRNKKKYGLITIK